MHIPSLYKKLKPSFLLRISLVNMTKSALTEEILNGKLHFLCSAYFIRRQYNSTFNVDNFRGIIPLIRLCVRFDRLGQ